MKRSLFLFILFGLSFELQSQINLTHSGWEEASTYPGGKVDDGSGFVLNDKLFFGCGIDEFYRLRNQWYSYDLQTKQWFEIDSIPGNPRQYASTFTSNDFGFVVGGVLKHNQFSNECFQFDPLETKWTKLPDAPWKPRAAATVFQIGGYSYVLGGRNDSIRFNDMWRFDLRTNHWDSIGAIPTSGKDEMVGFSIQGYGYVLIGRESNLAVSNEFWRYDVLNNLWEKQEDYPGKARSYAAGVSTDYGAIVLGGQDDSLNLLAEAHFFDSDANQWTVLPEIPIEMRGMELLKHEGDYYTLGGLTHRFTRIDKVYHFSLIESNGSLSNVPFSVYPNPSTGAFAVKALLDEQIVSATLYDSRGFLLERFDNLNSDEFQLFDLNVGYSGIYILDVVGENESQKIKLVINN